MLTWFPRTRFNAIRRYVHIYGKRTLCVCQPVNVGIKGPDSVVQPNRANSFDYAHGFDRWIIRTLNWQTGD